MKAATCDLSGVGDRMRAARDALGLNQGDLATAVGGSKRGIQDNETRNRVPGGEVICGLIRLGINANWLLTGEGPMLLRDMAAAAAAAPVPYPAPEPVSHSVHEPVPKQAAQTADWLMGGSVPAPTAPTHEINLEVMEIILTVLDEVCQRRNIVLPPDRRAQFIALGYNIARRRGHLDPADFKEIVRLVA